jgi:hypothetical protein
MEFQVEKYALSGADKAANGIWARRRQQLNANLVVVR